MSNSNKHIEEFLDYYLNVEQSPDYAVLITGCWGSGKTYFIRKYLEGKGAAGKDVVKTFDPTLSRQENIARMAEKINEVGPLNVSKHLADFTKVNAIDVDKESLSSVLAFKDAAKSAGFSKILDENNCIHIELAQP